MSGWIKLHRSIQDHFIYDFSEPDKAMAWIDILLSASYQESKVKVKSTLFTVSKGQWLVSQVTLQKRWRMSQNKVKRLLKLLENDGMIRLNTNDLTSVITICNYNDYQNDERPNEQSYGRAGERGTDDHTNDIQRNKEFKEGKEVKDLVDSGESPAAKNDFLLELFGKFWQHYKYKQGKQAAVKSFRKFMAKMPEGKCRFWMNLMLAYYMDCQDKGVLGYEKLHAATYINNKRWEDNPDFMAQFKQQWIEDHANGSS